MNALLLQLADSAFPSGAFAHSSGFEALRQIGRLGGEADLDLRLRELAWQTALGSLPFLADAHAGEALRGPGAERAGVAGEALRGPGAEGAAEADRAADAFLASHVGNRASRAQGRAFLLAANVAFPGLADLGPLLPCGHAAPAMGAAFARLGVSLDDARQIVLFGAVRAALSAAVRLGVVGPLRGQALLYGLHPHLDRVRAETRGLGAADACHVAPLVEAAQAGHDRLHSRLFQS
jgi:urease accessory protein